MFVFVSKNPRTISKTIAITLDWCLLLQAQLRGMIGDFKGGDETALAQALEAFDILANTTEEYHAKGAHPPEGGASAAPADASAVPALRPPATSNPFQARSTHILPYAVASQHVLPLLCRASIIGVTMTLRAG